MGSYFIHFAERCEEGQKRKNVKEIYVMKKNYHLCISAGNEVMFRDLSDYHRGFNCFALALHSSDSTGLVESFMATHVHILVQTSSPEDLMHKFRKSYSMYFNHKYGRVGKLGEKTHFTMEIVGHYHLIAAMSYILRNPLHHGLVPIPYSYPHCSANYIFRREMGKFDNEKITPRQHHKRFLSRRAEYPDYYKMSESGIFLRDSVLDIPQVENAFGTPRAFNYYMNRKSSEEWEAEQKRDESSSAIINLAAIETNVKLNHIDQMLRFENGKGDYRKITDTELCTELDILVRNRYNRLSVYQLTDAEKQHIASEIYRSRHISSTQLRRCLAM